MPNYTTRAYSFSDQSLIDLAEERLSFVKRDWVDFLHDEDMESVFKSTLIAQKAMEQAMNRFFASNKYLLSLELASEKLREKISHLETELYIASGATSPLNAEKRLERLTQFSDTNLLAIAIAIVKRARFHIGKGSLSDLGIACTQFLDIQCHIFENQLAAKVRKQVERALADEECAFVGNLLYDRLNFLCNIGKRKYFQKNWDKYCKYILPDENQNVTRIITLVNHYRKGYNANVAGK
jgi:hypothetical protein